MSGRRPGFGLNVWAIATRRRDGRPALVKAIALGFAPSTRGYPIALFETRAKVRLHLTYLRLRGMKGFHAERVRVDTRIIGVAK